MALTTVRDTEEINEHDGTGSSSSSNSSCTSYRETTRGESNVSSIEGYSGDQSSISDNSTDGGSEYGKIKSNVFYDAINREKRVGFEDHSLNRAVEDVASKIVTKNAGRDERDGDLETLALHKKCVFSQLNHQDDEERKYPSINLNRHRHHHRQQHQINLPHFLHKENLEMMHNDSYQYIDSSNQGKYSHVTDHNLKLSENKKVNRQIEHVKDSLESNFQTRVENEENQPTLQKQILEQKNAGINDSFVVNNKNNQLPFTGKGMALEPTSSRLSSSPHSTNPHEKKLTRLMSRRHSQQSNACAETSAPLNGIGLLEPFDPRIAFNRVYMMSLCFPSIRRSKEEYDALEDKVEQTIASPSSSQRSNHDKLSCYSNLIEACRPFFNDSQAIFSFKKIPFISGHSNMCSDEAHSSSGFTSFFTTTKSESNQNMGSEESSSEFSDHLRVSAKNKTVMTGDSMTQCPQRLDFFKHAHTKGIENRVINTSSINDCASYASQSNSSSMVVLTRVKRKDKDPLLDDALSSYTKNETVPVNYELNNDDEATHANDEQTKHHQPDSYSLSTNAKCLQYQHHTSDKAVYCGHSAHREVSEKVNGHASDAKSLTSSADKNDRRNNVSLSREVTDISGTTTANNSSVSGSGSNENATTELHSGDHVDFTDENDTMISDHFECNAGTVIQKQVVNRNERKTRALPSLNSDASHLHNHNCCKATAMCESIAEENAHLMTTDSALTEENKMIQKKRKRMSARREFEVEWQRQIHDSSEINCRVDHSSFQPGKCVTLEEVLSFSQTARLLLQVMPPLLVVYTNAAFTKLTGIYSQAVIGKPIADIISIPEVASNDERDSEGDGSNKEAISSLSESIECHDSQNDTVMAVTCNERLHEQRVPSIEHQHVGIPSSSAALQIDRLIVARGYGQVHNVEVIFIPTQSKINSIEGTDIDIMKGRRGTAKNKNKILCRMSVSPVVSSTCKSSAGGYQPVCSHTENHQTALYNKRRKSETKNLLRINHYLIQLEATEGPCYLTSRSSLTSTTDATIEAQLLGITKTDLFARRCKLNRLSSTEEHEELLPSRDENSTQEMNDSHDTSMDPVATCG